MMIGKSNANALKRIFLLLLSAAFFAGLAGCGQQQGETSEAAGTQGTPEKKKIFRVGYQKGGETLLLKNKKILESKLGEKGYQVEWAEFSTGMSILEALNAGSIDFANSGDAPSLFALARGMDFVYVASTPSAPKSEGILVKKDSDIHEISDLKGKKIAFNKASISQYLLTQALKTVGLAIEDVEPVYLNPPDASIAFAQGQVDAWVVWDPYFTVAAENGENRILADATNIVPYRSFFESSRKYAEQHPEVIAETVKALQEVCREINADPTEAAALLEEATNIPAPSWKTILSHRPSDITFVEPEAVDDLQKMADDFLQIGFIEKPLNVKDAVWTPE